ncbi:MAG TPA: nitroreductase [Rhizomicrobium sp.]|nr:nitroreductase [Rhizomicrobium sp.]
MNVSEAIASRRSVRAFLDRDVPEEILRRILTLAARAPSGGNLQPWRIYVLTGEPLSALKARMRARLAANPAPDPREYEIYPENLWEPYRTQRYRVGEMMYAELGIPRENREGRLARLRCNYDLFGAPVGLFCYIDRGMGPPQWSDLGMYLENVMLLLCEDGLASCPQECWSTYNRVVAEVISPPHELMLFCGMSIGYEDCAAPVNRWTTERMNLEEFATFRGFLQHT